MMPPPYLLASGQGSSRLGPAWFMAKITSHGFPRTELTHPSPLEDPTPGSCNHLFLGEPEEGGGHRTPPLIPKLYKLSTLSKPEPRVGWGRAGCPQVLLVGFFFF